MKCNNEIIKIFVEKEEYCDWMNTLCNCEKQEHIFRIIIIIGIILYGIYTLAQKVYDHPIFNNIKEILL